MSEMVVVVVVAVIVVVGGGECISIPFSTVTSKKTKNQKPQSNIK